MKALPLLLLSAAAALFAVGCNLESVDTAGETNSSAKTASSTTAVETSSTTTPTSSVTPKTTAKSTSTTAKTTTAAQAVAAPAGNPTSLFVTTPNSLTLRSDFAAVVGGIDALTRIIDGPGGSSVAVQASRSGNTWTLPQSLAAYPRGNVPNTWRIRLRSRPPAGVTYHVNIMQTFIRVGDNPYGPGNKTYPPTTR